MSPVSMNLLNQITYCLQKAGYDPYNQLYGYLHTGNPHFITRTGDARAKAQRVSKADIAQYIAQLVEK